MQSMMAGRMLSIGAALLLATEALAQEPTRPPRDSATRMMPGASGMMGGARMMDSANARLDSLAQRMNQATGDKKVRAMADVINELVAQRRSMHAQMQRMMGSTATMGAMGQKDSGEVRGRGASDAPRDTAEAKPSPTDTADHAQHHKP